MSSGPCPSAVTKGAPKPAIFQLTHVSLKKNQDFDPKGKYLRRGCSACYFCGEYEDPVVPTLRGASRDAIIVYADLDTKGRFFFLQSLALLRAGQNPSQRREMTVSTNNGSQE